MTNPFNTKRNILQAYAILSLAILFFLFEFVLQVSPAVMTSELMSSFNLNAAGLSGLAAFFYYGYTPMQLPGGLLYDRFGPRVVVTGAALICTIGALLFVIAPSYEIAALGRLLMGVGGAFSFVGAFLLASRWFPSKYFPVITGLIQSLGCVAAVIGQVPLAVVVGVAGWRHTLLGVFVIGVLLVILMPIIIRDHPPGMKIEKQKPNWANWLHHLKMVFHKPQTWIMALYSFFSWAPMTVFGALWGVAYLRGVYPISTSAAAEMLAVVWLGVAVGSPFFGWLSEKIGQRRLPLFIPPVLGFLGTCFMLFLPMSIPLMLCMLFLFGIGTSGQTLIFSVVRDINSPKTVGTAMGFNNLAVVAGGMICQPLAGYLLAREWAGQMANGVPIYDVHAYKVALIMIPISFLLCAIFGRFFVQETHCKPVHPDAHHN